MKWMTLAVAALGCAAAGTVMAEDSESDTQGARAPLTFEVTPYLGYRFGGTFTLAGTDTHVDINNHASYALALDLSPDAQATQYELFYSRQSTSLGAQSPVRTNVVIEYLQIGGTTTFVESPASRLQPYLLGTMGVTRFDPALGDHSTNFSASLGMGVRTALAPHFALRVEARGFVTVLSSSTAVFCRSNQTGGVCEIQARGSGFVQADILAGVSYEF